MYVLFDGAADRRKPIEGWAWLADQMVNDRDHYFTGVRWCYGLSEGPHGEEEGQVVKLYEGRGCTLIDGFIVGGKGSRAWIASINRRLGITDRDFETILHSIPLPSASPQTPPAELITIRLLLSLARR